MQKFSTKKKKRTEEQGDEVAAHSEQCLVKKGSILLKCAPITEVQEKFWGAEWHLKQKAVLSSSTKCWKGVDLGYKMNRDEGLMQSTAKLKKRTNCIRKKGVAESPVGVSLPPVEGLGKKWTALGGKGL